VNTVSDKVVWHSLTSLSVQKMVHWGRLHYVKIGLKLTNPLQKTPISNEYSLVAPQP